MTHDGERLADGTEEGQLHAASQLEDVEGLAVKNTSFCCFFVPHQRDSPKLKT